jgi:hypothetical protein
MTFKIMARNLNEIVRSWIWLLVSIELCRHQTLSAACNHCHYKAIVAWGGAKLLTFMFRAPLQRAIFCFLKEPGTLKFTLKTSAIVYEVETVWLEPFSSDPPPPLLAVKWCVGTAMYRQEAYGEEKWFYRSLVLICPLWVQMRKWQGVYR